MIWGADDDGDSADCISDIDSVLSQINWVDKDMSGKIRDSRLNASPMVFSW
jgi:hypothetical protein